MLQFLYSECAVAAQKLAETAAPEINEVSKEDIAEAATEHAHVLADQVADHVELAQDQHAALIDALAQVIYTNTCSELAKGLAEENIEALFSEEIVEDYYAGIEEELQDIYADEKKDSFFKKAGDHLKNNSRVYVDAGAGVVGAGAGALIARRKAQRAAAAKGLKPGTSEYKSFVRKRMAAGGAIGAVAGAGTSEAARTAIRYHSISKDAKESALNDLLSTTDKLKGAVSGKKYLDRKGAIMDAVSANVKRTVKKAFK